MRGRRKEGGALLALSAIAAPSAASPAQLAIASHHATEPSRGALALSVWRGEDSYVHDLISTRDETLPTSSSVTISRAPCEPGSPILLSAAPRASDQADAVITLSMCNEGSNTTPIHATAPVRITDQEIAVWGEAYAAQGYTLEDTGLGRTGLGASRIWFMSREGEGELNLRGAEWQESRFMADERAMGPGNPGFTQRVRSAWLNGCGQNASLEAGARSMVLPHPTEHGRAQLFVRTNAGPQVLAWDDMVNGAGMVAPQPSCAPQQLQGLRWVDRVVVGARWLGVGTDAAGDVGLMGGEWAQDRPTILRLDLVQALEAKDMATDGARVWLLVTRGADVLLLELTPEGAPVCAP
jgi:hypothetical protein